MKQLLFLTAFVLSIGLASNAQTEQPKLKSTSTAGQKVHNTFSKHKHHNGYKVKSEKHGVKHKKKVNTKTGRTKTKN